MCMRKKAETVIIRPSISIVFMHNNKNRFTSSTGNLNIRSLTAFIILNNQTPFIPQIGKE